MRCCAKRPTASLLERSLTVARRRQPTRLGSLRVLRFRRAWRERVHNNAASVRCCAKRPTASLLERSLPVAHRRQPAHLGSLRISALSPCVERTSTQQCCIRALLCKASDSFVAREKPARRPSSSSLRAWVLYAFLRFRRAWRERVRNDGASVRCCAKRPTASLLERSLTVARRRQPARLGSLRVLRFRRAWRERVRNDGASVRCCAKRPTASLLERSLTVARRRQPTRLGSLRVSALSPCVERTSTQQCCIRALLCKAPDSFLAREKPDRRPSQAACALGFSTRSALSPCVERTSTQRWCIRSLLCKASDSFVAREKSDGRPSQVAYALGFSTRFCAFAVRGENEYATMVHPFVVVQSARQLRCSREACPSLIAGSLPVAG